MDVLEAINRWIWGVPALLLILGVGMYLSIKTGFVQFRLLPQALRRLFTIIKDRKRNEQCVSQFRALCTALAATVGVGNLAGVAGAIAIGGPGSIFWMWISGFLGMVTKFAEASLAVRYRTKNSVGELVGGPMHMVVYGMGRRWRWLATTYAFFGVVAAFGVGNATQINAVIGSINSAIVAFGGKESSVHNLLIGSILATIVGAAFWGGAKRIGQIAEKAIPIISCAYLLFALGVIVLKWNTLPNAFLSIFKGAFSPAAVTGGAVGTFFQAMSVGTRRGVFTNEAGMGTASIAHAAADVRHPIEQGFMGIIEVFVDTIVICTLTALVILSSGVSIDYGTDIGIALTAKAYCSVYGNWFNVFLSLALAGFALATVLGWGLYGLRCAQFLFGDQAWRMFAFLQIITVLLGAVLNTQTVWVLAEIVNGLMAIPNLIALFYLSPELIRLLHEYQETCGRKYLQCKLNEKNVDFCMQCVRIRKNKNGNAEAKKILPP